MIDHADKTSVLARVLRGRDELWRTSPSAALSPAWGSLGRAGASLFMSEAILQAVKLDAGSLAGRFSRRVREFLMPWSTDVDGVVTYRVVEPTVPRQAEEDRRSHLRR